MNRVDQMMNQFAIIAFHRVLQQRDKTLLSY